MFLSCVFHVGHVAMGLKLFLQIKAYGCLCLGSLCSCLVAHIPGSWQLALVLWASSGHHRSLHTLTKGIEDSVGHPGTGQQWQTVLWKWGRKEACNGRLFSIRQYKPGCSPWDTFSVLVCLCSLFWSLITLRAYQHSRQKLCSTNDHFHTSKAASRMLFSPLFSSKSLLSGAPWDGYKCLHCV